MKSLLASINIADRLTAKKLCKEHPQIHFLSVGEIDPSAWTSFGEKRWIPLEDSERIEPIEFRSATDEYHRLQSVGTCCVFCWSGESRSTAVIAGWLLLYHREFVYSLPTSTEAFETLPVLFQESHSWVKDKNEIKSRFGNDLDQLRVLEQVLKCYCFLAKKYPRVYLNLPLWSTLIRHQIFNSV